MRQVVGLLTIVFLGITVIAYAAVTVPNTFSSGTTISSTEVNNNFTALGNAMPAGKTAEATSLALGGTYSNIITLPITAPTAGYVFLTANGMLQLSGKTTAGYSSIYVGITNVSGGSPASNNYTRFYLDSSQAGSYEIPYGVHAIFPVTAGLNTFYLVGIENGTSGSGAAYFNRLTVLFVPGTALP